MANKANLRICLVISMFLLVMAGPAQGATITVGPGVSYDFDTTQAGIDAAVDGDTVLVAPGEYVITEPITFRGKAITVQSEAGPEVTTIRMDTPADSNRGSVVVFENNETAASVLDGFTITGGRGCWRVDPYPPGNRWSGWVGGGILCWEASPTIVACKIAQNRVVDHGAGVLCLNSDVILTNCIIAENSAGVDCGGMDAISGSSPSLTNCTIRGNSATRFAGGVESWDNSSVIMTNCIIAENSTAQDAGAGVACLDASLTMNRCRIIRNTAQNWFAGGVYVGGSGGRAGSAILTNCIIAQNTATRGGGGVACSYPGASLTISNCTIWSNSGGVYWGGGGVLCRNASATVTNSIVWGNTSPKGSEISVEDPASTLTIAYSNVAGGQAGVSVEGGCTLNWGAGNIDADPLLARLGYMDKNGTRDPSDDFWVDGDYHLKSQAGRWTSASSVEPDPNSQTWVLDDVTSLSIDAGDPNSDWTAELWPHGERINMGAYGGTSEASMSLSDAGAVVYIQWLGHSSVKIWTEDCIIYVDPERVPESLHDATLVCVTHTHGDHYSPSDISRVSNPETQFIAPPDVVQQYGSGQTIAPGQTIEFDNVNIIAVPAYNTNKPNHPKSRNWVGFIIELGSKRIYVAGDTDLIEEMKTLGDIDVAILPAGGTYTMNAVEAAEATQYIQPELAIPYHWGQSVGTLSDAQTFAQEAACAVKILTVGETISSEDWPKYSPLIAHWELDETEGGIAYDSAGDNDGSCLGGPFWQSNSGKVNGAIQLDGIDDYISTDFVLDPAEGAFSVFAWIKGGAAGQVIISQTDGTGTGETWIGAEASDGKLMTGLVPPAVGRSAPQPLVSESVITDGQWHHVGLVWDRSYRYLYVDGIEAARDTKTLALLKSSDGGLYIGAGKNLTAASFFSGLIDDVRIYNRAVSP